MKSFFESQVYLFLLLCFFTTNLLSQNTEIHFNSGLNFYSMKGQIINSTDTVDIGWQNGKYGFQVGYGMEFNIAKHVSVLTGLEFSQRNLDEKDLDLKNAYRYNYMSLPVSINYGLFEKLKINLGLQVDYLIHKQKVNYIEFENLKSGFSEFDLAFSGGIRYRFRSIELNLSALLGMFYIVHADIEPSNQFSDYSKSQMVKFGVSYIVK